MIKDTILITLPILRQMPLKITLISIPIVIMAIPTRLKPAITILNLQATLKTKKAVVNDQILSDLITTIKLIISICFYRLKFQLKAAISFFLNSLLANKNPFPESISQYSNWVIIQTMSYQKKSIILQQLEQAIRKKAQEKSRHKDQANKLLQGSVEKKKNVLRTATNKDNRLSSTHKQSEAILKPPQHPQPPSLFNNEQLNTIESGEFKCRKYNNRRLDKLVSLIQYMVSSSEKALKYISSTNFEAEFALKLYRSDKDNLLSELKNLTLQDILDSQRSYQKIPGKNDLNINTLLEENSKLKKDILVLQKQAQRFHKQSHGIVVDDHSKSITDRENGKLKQIIRKLIPFESYKQVVELLDKEGKFEAMSLKCQQNSKKITEIEIVISSIEHERNAIVENAVKNKQSRVEARSERTYRMGDIQEEKEQLQRQIANLKAKLIDIKESSRTIAELELLRKNSELTNERLASLANELSNSNSLSSGTRSSEQLIDLIRSISLNYLTIHQEITAKIGDLQQECDILRRQNLSFRKYRSESQEEFNNSEKKMENMLTEIEKFKEIIEQLESDRERAMEHIKQLELNVRQKQEDIQNLHEKFNEINEDDKERQEFQMKIKEMKKQQQTLLRKWEDKQQFYREKILKSEEIKNELEDKIMDMAEELEHQRNELLELARKNESMEDSRDLTYERMKIQYQSREEDYVSRIHWLQTENKEQQNHHTSLKVSYQQVLTDMDKLTHSNSQKNQLIQSLESEVQTLQQKTKEMQVKLKNAKTEVEEKLKDEMTSLEEEINQLNNELDRVIKENAALTQKLRSTQNEMISNSYANEEVINLRQENSILSKKIQHLEETHTKSHSKDSHLNKKIVDLERELEEKINDYEELDEAHHKIKNDWKNKEQQLEKLKKELNKLQLDISFLTQEKNSLQKIMEEHNIKYCNETQQLNRQFEQLQMKFIKTNQDNQQYKLALETQREKIQGFKSKIQMLEQSLRELQDEMASLTHLSNEIRYEKDNSVGLLNILGQEKEKLQMELNTTKQQIQQSSMINHSQKKQYVILLKQILKGIGLENDDFADRSSFEELLEFGSQQAVQMRKKQRDEESNRRKTQKEQDYYGYQYEEEYSGAKQSSPALQDCKVQLFSMEKEQPQQAKSNEKSTNKIREQVHDLNDFNQMQEEGLNDSMMSQQNQQPLQHFQQIVTERKEEQGEEEVDLDDFNDLQSQKLNDSAISNARQELQQENRSQQDKKAHSHQNQANYKQNDQQDLSKSGQKDKSEQFVSINEQAAKKSQNESNNLEEFQSIDEQVNDSMMSGIEIKERQKNSMNSQEDDPFIVKNLSNLSQFNEILENANDSVLTDHLNQLSSSPERKNFSDFNDLSQNPANDSAVSQQIKQKSPNMELNNLQDFQEVKSDQMNESVVSSYRIKKNNSDEAKEKLRDDLSQHSPVKAEFKADQDEEEAVDLDQFNELPANQMNDSMMSDQGLSQFAEVEEEKLNESSHSEHGLSQFGEINQQNMTESMVSEKQHGLSQFGDIQQEEMNSSMISEKQQGLSQFGEIQQEEMNASMVSDKDHGLSDFGEMEDKMNDSVLSEQNRPPQSKEADLQEFDEYSPDKLNDSVLSQKMDQ